MSRALVLGGGGPVGIGWQSGLIVGLKEAGVDLTASDYTVGTSAGALCGAQLMGGHDLARTLDLLGGLTGDMGDVAGGAMAFMAAMMEIAGSATPETGRQELARRAEAAGVIEEERFVAMFAELASRDWPARYACTAIDAETGGLQVWDERTDAPLDRAVASSCAVPLIFPPVTIAGRRYFDGGLRTALNADLAAGHDRVVAVSCFPLQLPPGFSMPALDALMAAVAAELDAVRAQGTLETIVPGDEFMAISGGGMNLMDFARAADAYAAGVRQAAVEAERLASHWT